MAQRRSYLSFEDLVDDIETAREALKARGYEGATVSECALLVIAKRIDELECSLSFELDFIGERLDKER